jgi:hypothetical protein
MTLPRETQSQSFAMAQSALRALGRDQEIAPLVGPSTRSVEAWFLGPKGENADELERLVVEALRDQVFWRRSFHPGDPTHITEAIKATPDYLQALGALKEGFRELLAFLKKSVPFFSMRYQGHMNWEVTLPGLLGYFAAMLYNPNNVAFEGATATTILELLVGDDLCRMLGYDVPATKDVRPGAIRPWGHITCDGTVANIEAIWSARNLKLYPLAVREAIAEDAALAPARKLEISLPTGASAQLVDLSHVRKVMHEAKGDAMRGKSSASDADRRGSGPTRG